VCRAQVYFERGNLAAARLDLERSLGILDASGNASSVDAARAKAYLARIAFERNDPDLAYRTMDEVLTIERARSGEESADYSQMLQWKALLLIRGGRSGEAAPLLDRAQLIAERQDATDEPRLLLSRDETAAAYCLARHSAEARRALDQARGMTHAEVPPEARWLEAAVGAACGPGDANARRAAWAAARARVAGLLGPRAPMIHLFDALPLPPA
ncbi:MAG: hypothetical protein KGL92_13895, partial [Gammaproteobacteria bacterium]|nr:hypothetical protein [Gammaproteobacteria bacterium]